MYTQEKIKNLIKKFSSSKPSPEEEINSVSQLALGRAVNTDELGHFEQLLSVHKGDLFDALYQMLLSNEGLERATRRAMQNHLYFIHNARLKMIRTLLPKGERILDLGGANCPLYEMGYPHQFKHLVMVDLPPDERHVDFKKNVKNERQEGQIEILYSDMTRLSSLEDHSFDFIWSGQSIEHISYEDGKRMCAEAYRLLSPNGVFALDTPNRLITELHTATIGGGFVHPDHKIEYTPELLSKLLMDSGFKIIEEKGICEMPQTAKTKSFKYEDFVLGSPISANINDSYILYYACTKA